MWGDLFYFHPTARVCMSGGFPSKRSPSFPLGNYQSPLVHGFEERVVTDDGHGLGNLESQVLHVSTPVQPEVSM